MLGQQPLIVAPGDFAEAEVALDTQGSKGELQKEFLAVTDSDDPDLRIIPFQLVVNVLRPIEAIPSALNFGNANPNASITKTIRILVREPGLLETFQQIESDNAEISISSVRQQPGMLTFDALLENGLPSGDLVGKITIRFEHERFDEFTLPIIGRIVSDLQSIPRKIVFFNASVTKQRLCIKSKRGQSFQIINISSPVGIEVTDFDKAEQGDIHYMKVLKEISSATSASGFVRLTTDHPDQKLLRILVE